MTGVWQHLPLRLARYGWSLLLVALGLGLLGGLLEAVIGQPDPAAGAAPADPCPSPPCFDMRLDDLPLSVLPILLSVLAYVVVLMLGLPTAVAGIWDCLRGRWAVGSRRLLPFVGPLLVIIGTELVPHLLNPCTLPWLVTGRWPAGICEQTVHGVDVIGRLHQLQHTLFGAVPLVVLYGLALRRWYPAVLGRSRTRLPSTPQAR